MNYLQKNELFRKIIHKIKKKGAEDRIKKIKRYLDKKDKILDIGSGSCIVDEILKKEGYDITPIDIKNLSFAENVKPIIWNDGEMPFEENEFNISLILTVLHHAPVPENVLKEAKRVSKIIIIIEDIYTNIFDKRIAYFFDSLFNLEFINHPHTNKDDKAWKKTFNDMGLKLLDAEYYHSFFGVRRAIYCLGK
jgi:ubiquinone/menaquinone biosynthesis C-methylase UbiE